MRKPRQDGATRPGRATARTHLTGDDDPDRSSGFSSPTVEKPYPFVGDFSPSPDTSPSVYCKGGCPYHRSDIGFRGCSPRSHTAGGREVKRELACPAAQRAVRASSPDRAAGANGGAHQLDRPEAGACPPTRKADRQSDRRERNERRSLGGCGAVLDSRRLSPRRVPTRLWFGRVGYSRGATEHLRIRRFRR